MSKLKPVFLIGFMGSGKTTWGRKLATKTGRAFIDLDEVIVNRIGMPIADYFLQHGESAFRQIESETLKNLPLAEPAIVSTGGGTPCYFDNMEWMNNTGTTIYFHLPPKALWDRLIQTDIASRPALKGLSGQALLADITSKLADRAPYYEQATHVVNQLSLQLDELTTLIG
ncbi:shikimate kinase [Parapedobacter defluvii]|uniref:Shikimate kinase n=1 Tax=Parapedobacter defluvii TaxID=2045106 RepID=A0ABQ1MSC7_9SPHI|nr:shikimate kinase [Parapedobacter defluvii]RQP18667.1 MAG: shikimate kinase [Parapedobacter sp.]GGC45935.1 shikimate kinase [Parapedobacter defluvii]